jgi:hypothetical protein
LTTKQSLLNRAQQEAEHETEAVELTTTVTRVCGGLEGGFMSFDQHALMLSTFVRLIGESEITSSFESEQLPLTLTLRN